MRNWIFPIGSLDFARIDVNLGDLVAQQNHNLANFEP